MSCGRRGRAWPPCEETPWVTSPFICPVCIVCLSVLTLLTDGQGHREDASSAELELPLGSGCRPGDRPPRCEWSGCAVTTSACSGGSGDRDSGQHSPWGPCMKAAESGKAQWQLAGERRAGRGAGWGGGWLHPGVHGHHMSPAAPTYTGDNVALMHAGPLT